MAKKSSSNEKKNGKKQQVFFRAGVLGQMEEFRDERLGKIMSWMQSWIRGYLARKEYKKIQEQRLALQVVQRNLRKYMQLRTWPWWKLWQKVKPLLNVSRVEDEMAVSISSSIELRCRPPPLLALIYHKSIFAFTFKRWYIFWSRWQNLITN